MKSYSLLLILLVFPTPALAEISTLDEALALAYGHNPDLAAQQAKLRATDEQVSQALSNYRPNIDASGEAGLSKQKIDNGGLFSGDSSLKPRDAGVTITQPVFRGFRTAAGVHSAKATVKAGRAELLEAEQQLLLDTAKAYLDVVQAQELVEINRKNESDLKKYLEITRDRLRIGELKKTDVSQSQSRYTQARVARIQAENDLANSRVTFGRLVGEKPGTLKAPKLQLKQPATLEEAVAMAGENNPNVIAARYTKKAADSDVTVAEGSLLPEVELVGSANRGKDQNVQIRQQQDNFSVMAKMTIPLYRSGADYSKTRAAKQTVTQREMELRDMSNKAEEAARTSWQTLTAAREAISGNKEALEATDAALYGVKQEAKIGTRTTLDVLNAQQELLNARTSLVKATHDEAMAVLQLKAATGQLTAAAMKLPVILYDPDVNYNKARNKWAGLDITE
jgi:TolC family type I secretion outer membrane protein